MKNDVTDHFLITLLKKKFLLNSEKKYYVKLKTNFYLNYDLVIIHLRGKCRLSIRFENM